MTEPKRAPDEIVAALAAFPDELARAIAGQSREALAQPARDGGWGVVELVPHLRDWEEIFLGRVEAIIDQDQPDLPAFDDQLWAIERDYRGQDPHEALDQFRSLRATLVDHLDPGRPEIWGRVGVHATYGPVSLHWLAEHIHDNDEDHLRQVREALA